MDQDPTRLWRQRALWISAALLMIVLAAACQPPAGPAPAAKATATPRAQSRPAATPTPEAFGFSIVASGLINPRGLAFGPDGTLYVAEAGTGGPREIDLGRKRLHYLGASGRISAVTAGQAPRPVATNLPSIVTAAKEEVGPTGLAFLGDSLYVMTASGGWDVGDDNYNSGVFRVSQTGELQRILDLTRFNMGSPPLARQQDPRADVPAGMPYGLAAQSGALYATDGNHEVVLRITADGKAQRLLEYPASDRALTGIGAGPDGAVYVTEYVPGKVTRVTPAGDHADAAIGFALPIGVAFDGTGRMCVLEFVGRVICLNGPDSREVVASGLTRPTAMTPGPDGDLYVSNFGHFSANGEGEIVKVHPGR